jgi:hypothetical protein
MDLLLEIEDDLAEQVFWQVATLLNGELDMVFFDSTRRIGNESPLMTRSPATTANTVRLHEGIGYVTPDDEHHGRGEAIRAARRTGLTHAHQTRIAIRRALRKDHP